MYAFILAAGLGTRLRPLTDTMPKALVPVNGKPLLQHQIERLKEAGFTRIVVNVHHFADQIIDFLAANQNFGIDIRISNETACLLDTGGALKAAAPVFRSFGADDRSPILIHNVDILHNLDLRRFCQENADSAEATLLVSQRTTSRYFLFDQERQLVGWTNVKTGEVKGLSAHSSAVANDVAEGKLKQLAFSGIHLISPSLFPLMDAEPDRFSVVDFYLKNCSHHSIRGVEVAGFQMIDIGKIDTLNALSNSQIPIHYSA